MAQIKLAKFGVVDMEFVLGVGGYDLERYLILGGITLSYRTCDEDCTPM